MISGILDAILRQNQTFKHLQKPQGCWGIYTPQKTKEWLAGKFHHFEDACLMTI